ncbi:MAG: sugar ABC transporter ATP-binding protein [Mesorhizobium sp.]|nr:sugar ABC transporter ATP-binding protein [Mesorhizobium sp.]
MAPVVALRSATKSYGGVNAVEAVDFDVRPGEIHCLVGENGAGKSTLCKMMAGVVQPSSGAVEIDGIEAQLSSPADALRRGITMVFQETSLVPTMTVAQNLHLGREPIATALRPVFINAQQLLQSMGFHIDPRSVVARLSAAQKQMVEIARAVLHDARVIIFDEPTATLTPEEKQHFFSLLERLKRRSVAVVFISHAIEECLEHGDRITVMRDGKKTLTSPISETSRQAVIRSMVGRDIADASGRAGRPAVKRRRVLSVQNLTMGEIVKNTSFTVFAGEVTCMAGLIGSGRTETMKIVAGALKRNLVQGGVIELDGQPVRYRVPAQAVRDGVIYITEDRKLNGFFELMSAADNIYTGWLVANRQAILTSRGRAADVSRDWFSRLHIRAINPGVKVNRMSGGNQQKVVIAKSLVQKPRLVIFDEPTRGVDVGAISEIHAFIRQLASDGIAVVVISSYLPEVLALSDRILVCRGGRVVEEMDAASATEERIMFAAIH